MGYYMVMLVQKNYFWDHLGALKRLKNFTQANLLSILQQIKGKSNSIYEIRIVQKWLYMWINFILIGCGA